MKAGVVQSWLMFFCAHVLSLHARKARLHRARAGQTVGLRPHSWVAGPSMLI